MLVQSLGWEDPLEEGMATYSCIFCGEFPRIEEAGGPQSIICRKIQAFCQNHIFNIVKT